MMLRAKFFNGLALGFAISEYGVVRMDEDNPPDSEEAVQQFVDDNGIETRTYVTFMLGFIAVMLYL